MTLQEDRRNELKRKRDERESKKRRRDEDARSRLQDESSELQPVTLAAPASIPEPAIMVSLRESVLVTRPMTYSKQGMIQNAPMPTEESQVDGSIKP